MRYSTSFLISLLFGLTSSLAAATVNPDSLFQSLSPLPAHKSTARNIVDALAGKHYVDVIIDDKLSSEVFNKYLQDLDPNRSYFYASDIAEFEPYRYELDNALRKGNLKIGYNIFNRYLERVRERHEFVVQILESEFEQFDFTKKERLRFKRDEAPWIKTRKEMDKLWRKRAKNAILNLRLAKKEENKIQELLLKRYRNRLTRAGQTNSEDVFQVYMNAFTRSYDPHTQYFSPRSSENFNINMSLSLEGIGAVLQREDEFTKVVSLIHAGPADKSKQLKPNDKIVSVGQGMEGEMVDVIGWRLDEVVELIRGKKGTQVRLEVVPAGLSDISESNIVLLTRNRVEIEEQSAQSEILEIEQFGYTHKIGVIQIPTFYIDFQALQEGDPNFKSTTRDVRKLLVELEKAGVEGVVIDLRDNGGGSLQEANTLTGLFIDRGPTVQIRSKSNRVDVLNDRDYQTVYDGPLAVLVNRLSASASEIFAGAIQDYKRGIIIGSQTFGKGTVQSLVRLNRGQLKLTQAKFYRISGESTQHQGIIPDIAYPGSHDPNAIGESTLDDPLPWDRIRATGYRRKSNIAELIPDIKSRHAIRTSYNPDFEFLKKAIDFRRELEKEHSVSLNELDRISEKDKTDDHWLALENEKRRAKGKPEITSLEELEVKTTVAAASGSGSTGVTAPADGSGDSNTENSDTSRDSSLEGNEMAGVTGNLTPGINPPSQEEKPANGGGAEMVAAGEEDEEPDVYLLESGNILLDMISMGKRTAAKKVSERTI